MPWDASTVREFVPGGDARKRPPGKRCAWSERHGPLRRLGIHPHMTFLHASRAAGVVASVASFAAAAVVLPGPPGLAAVPPPATTATTPVAAAYGEAGALR